MTRLYHTKPKAELLSEIPIGDGTLVGGVPKRPYKFRTILQLEIPDLQPGDIVQVSAQFEATNPHKKQVMLSHMMTRGEPGSEDNDDGWTVIVPARRAGGNITRDRHHDPRVLIGAFEAEEEGDDEVRVVAWASSRGSKDGDALVIEKGQGGICAIVHGQGDAAALPTARNYGAPVSEL